MLAINGTTNHIHFLIGMKPNCSLSDMIREVKKSSASFVKEKGFSPFQFRWQEGYGAFSYGHSQLNNVIAYINNQEDHHRKKSFREEYIAFLKAFQIKYKNEHLFDWMDDSKE